MDSSTAPGPFPSRDARNRAAIRQIYLADLADKDQYECADGTIVVSMCSHVRLWFDGLEARLQVPHTGWRTLPVAVRR